MHKSRLGALVIDCRSDEFDRDADFWARAFACRMLRRCESGDENYRLLSPAPDDPKLLLQRVRHASRVHVDIETDDIDAEVQRLEQLGAVRVQQVRDWWVMQAPLVTDSASCAHNDQISMKMPTSGINLDVARHKT